MPELSVANARVRLSLPAVELQPGSVFYPRLELLAGASYTSLSLVLQGSHAVRLQDPLSNQKARPSAGSAGGAQAEVMKRSHIFYERELERFSSELADEKSSEGIVGGTYEAMVPTFKEGTLLLPTYVRVLNEPAARAEVKYQLVLVENRKGMFKINDTLLLAFPVSFPLPLTDISTRNRWDTISASSSDPVPVKATLSAQISHSSSTPIEFSLSLSPAPADGLLPSLSAFLSYEIESGPATSSVADQAIYTSSAIKVALAEIDAPTFNSDRVSWTGDVLPLPRERTIHCSAIKVNYLLSCVILGSSSSYLVEPLVVRLPVFLPSTDDRPRTYPHAPPPPLEADLPPPTYS